MIVSDIISAWNQGDYTNKKYAVNKLKLSQSFLPVKTYNFLAEKMGIALRPTGNFTENKEQTDILKEAQKLFGGKIIE